MASRCALCGYQEESAHHLFLSCNFSKKIWEWFYRSIDSSLCNSLANNSLMDMWLEICREKLKFSSLIFNILITGFVMVIYTIWRSRNDKIFRGKSTTFLQGISWIKLSLRSIDSKLKGIINGTVNDFVIVRCLDLTVRSKISNNIIPIFWTPPPPCWIKLNTDGLALGFPGPASIGGIFRSNKGQFLGGYMQAIGIKTTFYAEMYAVIVGIEFAWNNRWKNIWIESDSKSVVQCFMNSNYDAPWSLHKRWTNCRYYLAHMGYFCSHIFREGNTVADKLSKMGVGQESTWFDDCPPELHPLLVQDVNGCPNYRFSHYPNPTTFDFLDHLLNHA